MSYLDSTKKASFWKSLEVMDISWSSLELMSLRKCPAMLVGCISRKLRDSMTYKDPASTVQVSMLAEVNTLGLAKA